MQPPKNRERVTVNMPTQTKRRLKAIADDKHVSVNDLLIDASKNQIAHYDEERSYPDYVAERITSVLNSQMQIVKNQKDLAQQISDLTEAVAGLHSQIKALKEGR